MPILHWIFEALAYAVAFRFYILLRRRDGDALPGDQRSSVIAAAIAGAAIGSKLLNAFDNPQELAQHWHDPLYFLAGKTIVGGLIGGWIAVELVKRWLGIRRRSGDLFALPLTVGIAIGRVGCFTAGLADETYGVATTLPWGVDFGDGIHRHPTQLYEIAFLAGLFVMLNRFRHRPHREGDVFKAFMAGYMAFRLLVDFLKPGFPIVGLTAIQWACVGTLLFYARDLPLLFGRPEEAVLHG